MKQEKVRESTKIVQELWGRIWCIEIEIRLRSSAHIFDGFGAENFDHEVKVCKLVNKLVHFLEILILSIIHLYKTE